MSVFDAPTPHLILEKEPAVAEHVCFLRTSALLDLVVPWPRCQDLPKAAFVTPTCTDRVVAVSIPWIFVHHPDPFGVYHFELKNIVRRVLCTYPEKSKSCLVWCLEYLSVPQPPYLQEHSPLTPEHVRSRRSYRSHLLPTLFLYADCHVHLAPPAAPAARVIRFSQEVQKHDLEVQQCGEQVQVVSALGGAGGNAGGGGGWDGGRSPNHHLQVRPTSPLHERTFSMNSAVMNPAPHVRLLSMRPGGRAVQRPHLVQPGDVVVSVNSKYVASAADVDAAIPRRAAAKVVLERQPTSTPSSQNGWVFVERAMSAIHAALLDQDSFNHVIFSNQQSVLRAVSTTAQMISQAAAEDSRSAIASGRADVAFEGKTSASSSKCIVSFPGAYFHEWDGLVRLCEEDQLSTACVYLPKSDPKQRFGKHCANPETPGECYCHALYGEQKFWGCKWFTAWCDNVQNAVDAGLELIVVFFPGQCNTGVVHWDDLAEEGLSLWNKVGLGGSQKGEVAWLNRHGFPYTAMDVPEVNRHFGLRSAGLVTAGGSLSCALSELTAELREKDFFSPASVDEMQAAERLLHQLVAHVSEHWQKERAARRRRFDIWRANISSFMLREESLSPALASHIFATPASDLILLAELFVLPVLVSILGFCMPLGDPGAGLRENGLFLLMLVVQGLIIQLGGAFSIVDGLGRLPLRRLWQVILLQLPVALAAVLGLIVVSFVIDGFPVPYSLNVVVLPVTGALAPVALWLCIDSSGSNAFALRRLAWAYLAVSVLLAACLSLLPAMHAAFHLVPPAQQALLLPSLFLCKLLTERFCEFSVRRMNQADGLPYAVYVCVLCHKLLTSVLAADLSNVASYLIVVALDVLETANYLYCFCHTLQEGASQMDSGRCANLVATLLLRNIAKMVGSFHVAATEAALYAMPWSSCNAAAVLGLRPPAFQRWMSMLVMDFVAQCVVTALAFLGMRRLGLRPVGMLNGALRAYAPGAVVGAAVAPLMAMLQFHVVHTGTDQTFEFKWLRSANATWEPGHGWQD